MGEGRKGQERGELWGSRSRENVAYRSRSRETYFRDVTSVRKSSLCAYMHVHVCIIAQYITTECAYNYTEYTHRVKCEATH